LLTIESRNASSKSAGEPVTLFKNYEILREYPRPNRKPSRWNSI
jgi:hypothetical protein